MTNNALSVAPLNVMLFYQTMNILIVNQSVIDMMASFFTLLTAVVEVDGTRMSPDSIRDQFVCRFWLTRSPLWNALVTSTYGLLLMTVDRYVAVVYPVWYSTDVRTVKHVDFNRPTQMRSQDFNMSEATFPVRPRMEQRQNIIKICPHLQKLL